MSIQAINELQQSIVQNKQAQNKIARQLMQAHKVLNEKQSGFSSLEKKFKARKALLDQKEQLRKQRIQLDDDQKPYYIGREEEKHASKSIKLS